MFALSQLGVDPTTKLSAAAHRHSDGLFEELRILAAKSSASVQRISPSQFFAEQAAGAHTKPAVLVDRSGHLQVYLGSFLQDDELFRQVLHGADNPAMKLAQRFDVDSQLQEVWTISEGNSQGVPVMIGSGVIRFDRLWHNFGLLSPYSEMSSTFVIANEGPEPVVLQRPRTSCGCTVVNLGQPTVIPPGESLELDVTVKIANHSSLRQTVNLKFLAKDGRDLGIAVLTMLGNRRQTLSAVPGSLDFGAVPSNHNGVGRTLRFNELPGDRFKLTDIIVGNLPLETSIEQSLLSTGLSQFHVTVWLTADDQAPGVYEGDLQVITTSRFRPKVVVPVRYEVKPDVEAVPPTVAFGLVQVGQTESRKVRLISNVDQPFEVTLLDAPESCSVKIEQQDSSSTVAVRCHFDKPGSFNGEIRLQIRSSGRDAVMVLPCIAYVDGNAEQ